MSELQNEFKKIVSDLENHIQDKDELDYVKTQIFKISTLFIDEIDKVSDLSKNRVDNVLEKYNELTNRISKIESSIDNIEKELFVDDWSDFDIVCPYCNNEFSVDMNNESKGEVVCPECNNVIELDWNEDEKSGCSGNCGGCGHSCSDKDDEALDDDDDM